VPIITALAIVHGHIPIVTYNSEPAEKETEDVVDELKMEEEFSR